MIQKFANTWVGNPRICYFNIKNEMFVWDSRNCLKLDKKTKEFKHCFVHENPTFYHRAVFVKLVPVVEEYCFFFFAFFCLVEIGGHLLVDLAWMELQRFSDTQSPKNVIQHIQTFLLILDI